MPRPPPIPANCPPTDDGPRSSPCRTDTTPHHRTARALPPPKKPLPSNNRHYRLVLPWRLSPQKKGAIARRPSTPAHAQAPHSPDPLSTAPDQAASHHPGATPPLDMGKGAKKGTPTPPPRGVGRKRHRTRRTAPAREMSFRTHRDQTVRHCTAAVATATRHPSTTPDRRTPSQHVRSVLSTVIAHILDEPEGKTL